MATTVMSATATSPSPPPPPSHGGAAATAGRLTSQQPPTATDALGKRANSQRASLYAAKDRRSMYSTHSLTSQNRSRPGSHVFPIFHSNLTHALVRDFAYPVTHPLHYGPPPPRASGLSSPVSEHRRLSDPPGTGDGARAHWSTVPWSADQGYGYGYQHLPAMSFGDGPPYSEDEDLHSPIFTETSRRRGSDEEEGHRGRSGAGGHNGSNHPDGAAPPNDRGTFVGVNADGSETYYANDHDDDDRDESGDGPGGEYITYPANESRYSHLNHGGGYGHGHGHETYLGAASSEEPTRYAQDFQFAVGCPDEEMHGKAVALFDFEREHENELPLKEGQVIFVSYRHGQGWLVAEDPKTGESGLVPEEFVRLLRDIEGGLMSLNEDDSHSHSAALDMTGDRGHDHGHGHDDTTETGDVMTTPHVENGSGNCHAHGDHDVTLSTGNDTFETTQQRSNGTRKADHEPDPDISTGKKAAQKEAAVGTVTKT